MIKSTEVTLELNKEIDHTDYTAARADNKKHRYSASTD